MSPLGVGVYDHQAIEARWQRRWLAERVFAARPGRSLPKYYVLDMFPYPSGAGLHVGHPLSYTATDIVARSKRHLGFNVLHPMGWDAFGLPAEQYALRTGVHPAITTAQNVATFRRQLQALGFSYDWEREINTTDPAYTRWTQWIFLKLYEQGLAYQAEMPVNWCPAMGTVLANEEVLPDGTSEVGGHPVIRRPMKQWMLRITAYAERLLAGLDGLDWPEHVKEMQRNWIGRSEGAEIDFVLEPRADASPAGRSREGALSPPLTVFTTRPDTIFGATFLVVAPEHAAFDALVVPVRREEALAYRAAAARKSDLERTELAKDKSGVFSGSFARNPATGRPIPVWIADYVLSGYGTGAIMAVPGQDQRDWEFAAAHGLPVIRTVQPPAGFTGEAWTGGGPAVRSGFLDGLAVDDARAAAIGWLVREGHGRARVQFKLRDWLFSRQRYWGEPFPLLHLSDGSVVPLPEDSLPLTLPEVERYQPSGTGESPLANAVGWVETVDPRTGRPARRETHTMPQWAGSCWYYLRYISPHDGQRFVDPDEERYWMPVDLYIGGSEHAVLHLLYARFWHKVLFDLGLVSTDEPFRKLLNQGMILGEDGEKMSKSRGNVVNPDDMVAQFGADAFRLYEMFMGPLTATKPWQTAGLNGTHRFLKRFLRLYVADDGGLALSDLPPRPEHLRAFHVALDKVGRDTDALSFNTAIAAMMELVNVFTRLGVGMPRALARDALVILEPYAPHLAEELHAAIGGEDSLAWAPWPSVDRRWLARDLVKVPVQVNGKMRSVIEVPAECDAAALEAAAREESGVAALLAQGELLKVVAVPGRIVNFVVRPR